MGDLYISVVRVNVMHDGSFNLEQPDGNAVDGNAVDVFPSNIGIEVEFLKSNRPVIKLGFSRNEDSFDALLSDTSEMVSVLLKAQSHYYAFSIRNNQ